MIYSLLTDEKHKPKIMSTIKFILLSCISCIVLYSCQKESDETYYGALSGDSLSGNIPDWTYGSDKSILAYVQGTSDTIGIASISAEGSFVLHLNQPESNSLDPLLAHFDEQLTISDTSAKCSMLSFHVIDGSGFYFGQLIRGNNKLEYLENAARSSYWYTTRNTTLKGTYLHSSLNETNSITTDLEFKAGWNSIVALVTNYSATSNPIQIDYNFSNSEPSDCRWIFTITKK